MSLSTQGESNYTNTIILIGSVCAGKSMIAPLLAESLKLPRIALDDLFERYNEDLGHPATRIQAIAKEQSYLASYHTVSTNLCLPAVERVLREYRGHLIDFGAGYTHYEDEALFERVKQILQPYRHIILLLPSPDLDASVRILKERCTAQRGYDWVHEGYDFMAHWVKDHHNAELATLTVYTEGKTPEQTRDEILQRLMPREATP